jgi:P27 family predicted phage terminase small subunit
VREGNAGKRRLPDRLVLPDDDLAKPEGLPAAAAELWDDLVPILREANVLNRIDRAALEAMCLQWARGRAARAILAEEGVLAVGSTGQLTEHPALQIERNAHALFLRFASDFGITPVARARIAAAVAVAGATMRGELSKSLDLELDAAEVVDGD